MWNNSGNKNPDDPRWQGGPVASGDREFVMPMPDGSAWVYTPKQMSDLSQLDYTYDSLPKLAPAPSLLSQRLMRLGATADQVTAAIAAAPAGGNVELVGANQGALPIKGAGAITSVSLKSDVRREGERKI